MEESFNLGYWLILIWSFVPIIWAFFGVALILVVIGGARKDMEQD